MSEENTNTAMMAIEEEIAAQAKALKEATAGNPVIKTSRAGKFQIGEIESETNSMEVVIVDFVHANSWWEQAYVQGSKDLPDCFALGEVGKAYNQKNWSEMMPLDGCPDIQAASCGECPMNEFGSAATGSGKACGNNVTLALLPANDATAALHTMRLSPGALTGFGKYLRKVSATGKLPISVITTINVVEAGAGWAFNVDSDIIRPNPDLAEFYSRRPEAIELLDRAPTYDRDDKNVDIPKAPVRK